MNKKMAIILCCLTAHALYSNPRIQLLKKGSKALAGLVSIIYPAWLYLQHDGNLTEALQTARTHKDLMLDQVIHGAEACKSNPSKIRQGSNQIKNGLGNLAAGAKEAFDEAQRSTTEKN